MSGLSDMLLGVRAWSRSQEAIAHWCATTTADGPIQRKCPLRWAYFELSTAVTPHADPIAQGIVWRRMNEVKCSAAIPYPSRDLGSDAVNETYGIAVVKLPRAPPHKYVLSRKSLAFDYTPQPLLPAKTHPCGPYSKTCTTGLCYHLLEQLPRAPD